MEVGFGWSAYALSHVLLGGPTYYFRVVMEGNQASRLQPFIPDKVH